MKSGVITKITASALSLLLAGGCSSIYDWWSFYDEPKYQEPPLATGSVPVEPSIPPEPSIREASDSVPVSPRQISPVNPTLASVPAAPPDPVLVPVAQTTATSTPVPQPLVSQSVPAAPPDPVLVPAAQATVVPTLAPPEPKTPPSPAPKATPVLLIPVVPVAISSPLSVPEETLMPESSSEPVDIALTVAKERLEWATGIDAKTQFPVLYTQAVTAYTTAVKEKNTKNWNTAMTSAQATIAAVTEIEKLYEALKADEAYTALATAKVWMDWATGIGAKTKFPVLYTKAMSTYTSAVKAQGIKNWNSALLNAQATIVTAGEIEKLHEALKAKERDVAVTVIPEASPKSEAHLHSVSFTSTYTVKSGDCYWSIAHQFYGDAQKWRLIYDANKRGMRNPDNPHAIFPGMVLTIPGITER